ncbi:MAG: patatin-like phospholipase family protein [Alphaproteobacteria bacterium]
MITRKPRIGLALGSGSSRGWAHIGVLHELAEHGIEADLIAGCSAGGVVGAAWASNNLDKVEDWARSMTWGSIWSAMDLSLFGSGGFIKGEKLLDAFASHGLTGRIEDLDRPFGCVATDLSTGRPVWLREGDVLQALRASISLPGMFLPVRRGDRWLIDGGVVDPVPVGLARAMGADSVIGVNLNSDLLLPQVKPTIQQEQEEGWLDRAKPYLPEPLLQKLISAQDPDQPEDQPGVLAVFSRMIDIMQSQITQARHAGDPPDVMLEPWLNHIALMEYDRADEAIEEGRACVRRALPQLRRVFHMLDLPEPQ